MNRPLAVILPFAMFFTFGCNNLAQNTPQTTLPRSTAVVAGKTFAVQIADDDHERQVGYMFTPHIPDNEGMVFLFSQPSRLSFWNHNVPVALDVIYLRPDFTIDSIRTMPAQSNQSYPADSDQVQFVLEVAGGTAATLGIRPGDKVTFGPEILTAIAAAKSVY